MQTLATGVTLLPMSNDRVETHVVWTPGRVEAPSTSSSGGCSTGPNCQLWTSGSSAGAGPTGTGVVEAIGDADVVVLPPSNPVVSIGPILSVQGIRDAVLAARPRGGCLGHRRRASGQGHGGQVPGSDRGPGRFRCGVSALRRPSTGRPARRVGLRVRRSGPDAALASLATSTLMHDAHSTAELARETIGLVT